MRNVKNRKNIDDSEPQLVYPQLALFSRLRGHVNVQPPFLFLEPGHEKHPLIVYMTNMCVYPVEINVKNNMKSSVRVCCRAKKIVPGETLIANLDVQYGKVKQETPREGRSLVFTFTGNDKESAEVAKVVLVPMPATKRTAR